MKLHRDMFLSDRDMLDCDEVPPVRTFNATSGKKICALLSLSQASNVSHQHTESAARESRDIFCALVMQRFHPTCKTMTCQTPQEK